MTFGLSSMRAKLAEPGTLIRLAAWLTGAVAIVVLFQAAGMSRQAPVRIRSRLDDLSILTRQEQTVQAWIQARDSFLTAHAGKPGPFLDFKALAAQSGGASSYEIQELPRIPLTAGWEVVRVRVQAEQATLASLSPLIETAESAQPAWRLAALTIEPLSPKPGKGRVAIDFETLLPTAP